MKFKLLDVEGFSDKVNQRLLDAASTDGGTQVEDLLKVSVRQGAALYSEQKFAEAIPDLEIAFSILMRQDGVSDMHTDVLGMLADCLERAGQVSQAVTANYLLYKITPGAGQADNGDSQANPLIKIAELADEALKGASPIYEDAVDVYSQTKQILGDMSMGVGDHAGAIAHWEDIVSVDTSLNGTVIANDEMFVLNLCTAYMMTDDLVSAERTAMQAQSLIEQNPNAPEEAICRANFNLGQIRYGQGRNDEAVDLLTKALTFMEIQFGADDQRALDVHEMLAESFRDLGNEERAREHYVRSLKKQQADPTIVKRADGKQTHHYKLSDGVPDVEGIEEVLADVFMRSQDAAPEEQHETPPDGPSQENGLPTNIVNELQRLGGEAVQIRVIEASMRRVLSANADERKSMMFHALSLQEQGLVPYDVPNVDMTLVNRLNAYAEEKDLQVYPLVAGALAAELGLDDSKSTDPGASNVSGTTSKSVLNSSNKLGYLWWIGALACCVAAAFYFI